MIKENIAVLLICFAAGVNAKDIPLEDGMYVFAHRFSETEQYNIKSISLKVKIEDGYIAIINNDRDDVFPNGIIEKGYLMWHSGTSQCNKGDGSI